MMPILITASPKQLVCSYNDVDILKSEEAIFAGQDQISTNALPIGSQIAALSRFCNMFPNASSDYCNKLKAKKDMKEICLSSPELPKYTITFESNDLKTKDLVNGEFFYESCGGTFAQSIKYFLSDTKKVTLSATPSVISINGAASDKQTFNVDRKSLSAGYGTSRLFSCKVQDVDMSENQI